MALTKCKECGHEISTSATSCPNCGAKVKRTSLLAKILAIFLGLVTLIIVVGLFVGESFREQRRQAAHPTPTKWQYEQSDDEMTRGKVKTAFVRSLNQFEFGSPYQGLQRATLQLRAHPRYGKDVILIIERGQFLCRIDGCNVTVRFGDGKPQTFSASEPADHSTTVLFLRNHDRFVANAKKVNKVYIEAQIYQEGAPVFEFDVSGLKWP